MVTISNLVIRFGPPWIIKYVSNADLFKTISKQLRWSAYFAKTCNNVLRVQFGFIAGSNVALRLNLYTPPWAIPVYILPSTSCICISRNCQHPRLRIFYFPPRVPETFDKVWRHINLWVCQKNMCQIGIM